MTTIPRLPVQQYTQQDLPKSWECPVCLESEVSSKLLGHLATTSTDDKVSHIFHDECLKAWLAKNSNCPQCRVDLAARGVKIENAQQALIQINLQFPGLADAPQGYLRVISRNLVPTLMTSAALSVALGVLRGVSMMNLAHLATGVFVSSAASYGTRELLNVDGVSSNLDVRSFIKEVVASKPFLAGAAFVTAAAAFSTLGTLLLSLPAAGLGIGAHYAAQKLTEEGKISEHQKDKLQTITAIATGAITLVAPMQTMGLCLVGAAVGGLAEGLFSADRRFAQINPQAEASAD